MVNTLPVIILSCKVIPVAGHQHNSVLSTFKYFPFYYFSASNQGNEWYLMFEADPQIQTRFQQESD